MRNIVFFSLVLCSFILSSQTRILDSLWKVYRQPALADTTRLKALISIAHNYSVIKADSGRILAMLAVSEAKKINNIKAQASAYNTLGVNLMNLDSNKLAISAFSMCVRLGEQANDKSKIAAGYTNLGLVYAKLNEHAIALDYKLKALKIRQEMNDKKGIANAYANLGTTYADFADRTKALDCYLKSITMAEAANDKNLLANNYNNIGLLYRYKRDYGKAKDYFKKSIALKKELGNKRGVASSLYNLGDAWYREKNYAGALECFLQSYDLYREIGNAVGIAGALGSLGYYYHNLPEAEAGKINLSKSGKIEKAMQYHRQALEMNEHLGNLEDACLNKTNIAAAYYDLKDYKSAEKILLEVVKTAKEIHSFEREESAQEILSELYGKTKEVGKAFEAYKRAIYLRDTLRSFERDIEFTKKEAQYEYNKRAMADSLKNAETQRVKDAEIKSQKLALRQEKTQRLALYGGLIILLAFTVFAYNRFKVTQRQKHIIEQQKEEVEKQKMLVEEKQKEVMDSIHYAKRIQLSLLPNESFIQRILSKRKG